MANRPLFNGSARIVADNNLGGALRNAFVYRVSTAIIDTAVETIGNQTFEVEAGSLVTLNYDIRKYGAGAQTGTPTYAIISVTEENDNDATSPGTGTIFTSVDLIGGNALPLAGSVSFTPNTHGTFRIHLFIRKDNADTGATSDDWFCYSDGANGQGGLSLITNYTSMDKGRLRIGVDVTSITVTERGNTPPTKFALTQNAAGTAHEEACRIETVLAAGQNKQVAGTHVLRHKQRRNPLSTTDIDTQTTVQSATTHRTETVIDRLSYPNEGVNQSYDIQLTVATNSTLHTANTPQYTGLGGQAADGVWTYFTGVGTGLTLTDYKTISKSATHNVDASGSIENNGAYSALIYAEDSNGIPTVAEKFSFIFTDDNMVVKMGRVLNSRSEALKGIFVIGEVSHEGSGTNLVTWGNNDAIYVTRSNGWQTTAKTVTVTTPPSGIYKVVGTAYFPGPQGGTPTSQTFRAQRTESGSPASASTGKDWIAPASFSTSWIVGQDPLKGGVAATMSLTVFNKNAQGNIVPTDADFLPPVNIYKRTASGDFLATPFATPTVTKRASSTGIYDFTFTPTAIAVGGAPEVYQVGASVTVGSFARFYAEDVSAIPFDLATHEHSYADGSKKSKAFFRNFTGMEA